MTTLDLAVRPTHFPLVELQRGVLTKIWPNDASQSTTRLATTLSFIKTAHRIDLSGAFDNKFVLRRATRGQTEITQQKFTKDNQSSQWRASWNANEVLMYLVCPFIQYGHDAAVGFGKSNYSITQCNKYRVKESWLFSDFTSKQKFLVFLHRPQWRWLNT